MVTSELARGQTATRSVIERGSRVTWRWSHRTSGRSKPVITWNRRQKGHFLLLETTYSGRWTDFGTSINFALWIKFCLASACGGSMDNGEGQ